MSFGSESLDLRARPERDLRARPERVVVAGGSGSGKSTLARRLSAAFDLPYVELDALFHGPGWEPRPEFVRDVERIAATPRWICEWQYPAAQDILAARAQVMVWLDLSRRVVIRRVAVRTLRRRAHHEVLWNGNVEPPLRTFFRDPEHVVRWAWSTHGSVGPCVLAAADRNPELAVIRLRSPAAVRRWFADTVDRLGGASPVPSRGTLRT